MGLTVGLWVFGLASVHPLALPPQLSLPSLGLFWFVLYCWFLLPSVLLSCEVRSLIVVRRSCISGEIVVAAFTCSWVT